MELEDIWNLKKTAVVWKKYCDFCGCQRMSEVDDQTLKCDVCDETTQTYLKPFYRAESDLYRSIFPKVDDEGDDTYSWHDYIMSLPKNIRGRYSFNDDIRKAQKYVDSVQDSDWFKKSFIPNDSFLPKTEQAKIREKYVDRPRIKVEPTDYWYLGLYSDDTHSFRGHIRSDEGFDSETGKPLRIRKITVGAPSHNNKITLLHEMAHLKHSWDIPEGDERFEPKYHDIAHGPGFRGAFLHIIHHALGSEHAQALAKGYKRYGLDWNFDVIHPEHRIPSLIYSSDK